MVLIVLCAVLLMCGSQQCDDSPTEACNRAAIEAYAGVFMGSLGVLAAQQPSEDTRIFTDVHVQLGSSSPSPRSTTGPAGVDEAHLAVFNAQLTGLGLVYMLGSFAQDGRDVTVSLAPLGPSAIGTPQSITLNLTFADGDHAHGTCTYVESGTTFQGQADLDRQPPS